MRTIANHEGAISARTTRPKESGSDCDPLLARPSDRALLRPLPGRSTFTVREFLRAQNHATVSGFANVV